MKVTEVSIDKVILAEKSVRMHTEIQVKEFARSLEMFGQIRPIVVDGKYNIVCGNGLYLAAQSLGWAKVKVLVMNNLSEKDKKKLMIADNRIFELGVSNLEILDEFLRNCKTILLSLAMMKVLCRCSLAILTLLMPSWMITESLIKKKSKKLNHSRQQ